MEAALYYTTKRQTHKEAGTLDTRLSQPSVIHNNALKFLRFPLFLQILEIFLYI